MDSVVEINNKTDKYNEEEISTLRRYAQLVAKLGLIDTPVKVNLDKKGADVLIKSNIGSQGYSFSSLNDAVKWLWFVRSVADEVLKNIQNKNNGYIKKNVKEDNQRSKRDSEQVNSCRKDSKDKS
jgi:hypothetical protein